MKYSNEKVSKCDEDGEQQGRRQAGQMKLRSIQKKTADT